MTTYSVYQGSTHLLTFRADFAQASCPLEICDEKGCRPSGTPFQVADARHRPIEAAKMLNAWLRAEGGEAWARGTTGLTLRTHATLYAVVTFGTPRADYRGVYRTLEMARSVAYRLKGTGTCTAARVLECQTAALAKTADISRVRGGERTVFSA